MTAITKAYYMQLCAEARELNIAEQPYVLASLLNVSNGNNGGSPVWEIIKSIRGFSSGYNLATLKVYNKALTATPQDVQLGGGGYNVSINGGVFYNPNAVPVFLKFCDALAANVNVGTTDVVYKLMIPALGQVLLDSTKYYCDFLVSCTAYCTTGYLDANTTAPATGIELITDIAVTTQNPI